MRAEAWQKTGIDAEGELAFHTRTPSAAVAPPEIRPLSVFLRDSNRRQDAQIEMAPMLGAAAMDSAGDNLPKTAPPDVISTMANVTV
jgi:hypothetical protein